MDRALYIGMSGAKQVMRAQAVNSNNLANVNTVGFKKDFNHFVDVQVKGATYPSRAYAVTEGNGSDYSSGQLMQTGRDMDVSIKGDGFFVVQARDGGEALTRSGDFKISENGLLTNGSGLYIIGNDGGPIAIPPSDKVEIGVDGTVSIVPTGQDVSNMAVIDRIKLVKPGFDEVHKGDDGLFYAEKGRVNDPDASVRLISGFLESSNVNSVNEMVNMISNARLFEAQIKIMTAVKENDTASAKLLKLT